MGKDRVPGTPLARERTPEEIRKKITTTLRNLDKPAAGTSPPSRYWVWPAVGSLPRELCGDQANENGWRARRDSNSRPLGS